MIPIIDNTNIENRIETRVIELSSRVEYLEELDQDRWTSISTLHDQIKFMKSVINRQELNTKILIEGLNSAVNEINRLSRKKEKFSCHLAYITSRLCKFQKSVDARFPKIDEDITAIIVKFNTLSIE